jgi:hypothetical protein
MARKTVESQTPEQVAPETVQSSSVGSVAVAELKADVLRIYEESITIPEAERLAAKFLYAQMEISDEIKTKDLDARMRKAGVETTESQVLLDEIAKHDKKPSDSILTAIVATSSIVNEAKDSMFRAQTETEALKRLYEMLKDAHIFCRGIAKGNYDG